MNEREQSAVKPQTPPEWRTFKGVTAPCWIWCSLTSGGHLYASGDRSTWAAGEPRRVVRTWIKHSVRYAELDDGHHLRVGGVATRAWIATS